MKAEIKMKIPGPRSRALANKRIESVANGHGSVCGVYVDRAMGSNVIDVDGNVFIDFAGGIGTMNVGHSHPKILEAIERQISQFIHPCFTVAPYELYVKLAKKLSDLIPISDPCKAVFFNSGAEAVENAVKISKSYTKKNGVVVFSHGYHGRTQMTMSMTYKEDPYKKGFGPFVQNIHRLNFPKEDLDLSNLEFDPETIACLVIEPVAGEGGFIPVSKNAMIDLRKFCDKYGILMVADEVQTGFGRTGTLFAMEQFGVEPDMFTLAKSIAGGIPLSGVVGRRDIMDAPHVGGIGGTYGGNPVACAAALAVLEIMDEEELPKRSLQIGREISEMVQSIANQYPWVGGVRGLGAMQGIMIINPKNQEADKERTLRIHRYALENGLIMITCGTYGNIIRTLMPLNISDAELSQGLQILSDALINA